MAIEGVTSSSTHQKTDTGKAPGELGRDDFLNLLVTQLQYQDPLNPMDSADFTAQLAQFSSLEQLTNMNAQLEALTVSQSALNNSQAVAYIGRTVLSNGNATRITDGVPEPLQVALDAPAAEVFVSIYDDTGALRATFNSEAMAAGRGSIAWPGTDGDGNPLPNGDYRFEVAAVDGGGNQVAAYPLSSGRVSGVAFNDGQAGLVVNGQAVRMEDIIEVLRAESAEEP